MTKVLSFDPGTTSGWAFQDENGFKDGGQCDLVTVLDVLDRNNDCDVIVVEDYKILRKKALAHSGSRVEAAQVIGIIKAWAHRNKKPVVLYPSSLKPIQQKHSGVVPTGAHKHSHWIDAFNHGWWYLFQRKLVKSKLQQIKGV